MTVLPRRARREEIIRGYVECLARLAFGAPAIVNAICRGATARAQRRDSAQLCQHAAGLRTHSASGRGERHSDQLLPPEHSEYLMESVPALSRHDVAARRAYADRRAKAHRFGFARGSALEPQIPASLSCAQDGEKARLPRDFLAFLRLRCSFGQAVVLCSRFTRADFRTRPRYPNED